jgi:hypothetical protein
MNPEIAAFKIEVDGAKYLLGLAQILRRADAAADVTEIYRAALVKTVSGYDKFIHDLVYRGMLEAAYGRRRQTDAFGRFRVSVLASLSAASGELIDTWFGSEIVSNHGYLAFQMCEKVADAVRLISDVQLWNEISRKMRVGSPDLKAQINWVISRRNQIVHEADIDPVVKTEKRGITKQEALKSITLLYRVAREIDRVAG